MEFFEKRIQENIRVYALNDLRQIREKLGISVRQLAKETGLSPAAITKIEKQETSIKLETAERIENFLSGKLSSLNS